MFGKLEPAICIASKKVILLDSGHGQNTLGKRSPDESFKEYEFNRDIVSRISKELDKLNIRYEIITPELTDISLTTRSNRINDLCRKYGKENCLLISVHANAAGNGSSWMNARGWSIYTTKGITDSDKYADIIYQEAEKLIPQLGSKMRPYMNSELNKDWEENFYILAHTICPAVLTENLFYDNKEDLAILQSEEGRKAIAQLHINAIKRICEENY